MIIMLYKLYAKVNSTLYDFRNVPCHVKAKLLSTYCLDLCNLQLFANTFVCTILTALPTRLC